MMEHRRRSLLEGARSPERERDGALTASAGERDGGSEAAEPAGR